MRPTLPFEINEEIIKWVYRLSQDGDIDYSTLAVCARVCRTWTATSQRLLFRRLPDTLSPFPTSRPPLDIFKRNSVLATYVRCIVYVFHIDSAAVKLLRLFPNLMKIVLSQTIFLNRSFQERLRALNLPIAVIESSEHLRVSCEIIYTFLSIWPTVRFLNVQVRYKSDEQLSFGPLSGLCGLELILPIHPRQLEWLLSATDSDHSVCQLELNGRELDELGMLSLVTPGVCRRIRSLTIHAFLPSEIMRQFTGLERYVFEQLPDAAPTAMPTTLQHIGYHRTIRHLEHTKDVAFLTAWFATLPQLELVSATRGSYPETLGIIAGACHKLDGIDFVIYPSANAFPRAGNVDWI